MSALGRRTPTVRAGVGGGALRTALGVLLFLLGGLGTAHGQPRVRQLSNPDPEGGASFETLVRAQAGATVGDRLPAMGAANPLVPSVYVTVGVRGLWVWDHPILELPTGSIPRNFLAMCPGGPCVPALRDAAAVALGEQIETIRRRGLDSDPRFLIIADAEASFDTLLIVLRSLASASRGAPAGMDLLVKTAKGLGSWPIYILPPDGVPARAIANPQLLELELAPSGWRARARPFYLRGVFELPDAAALEQTLGHLHSRDPNRRVIFLAAPPRTAVRLVAHAIDRVHELYPVAVLRLPGPLPVRAVRLPPPSAGATP